MSAGPTPPLVGALIVGGLAASAVWWSWAVQRVPAALPRLVRRRPVPWNLADLAVVVLAWMLALLGTARLLDAIWPPESAAAVRAHPLQRQHPVVQLLLREPNGLTLLLCLSSAVVVAPIAEEFFFRVLLQGWLEKAVGQARRGRPAEVRRRWRWLPVAGSAAVFAVVHVRTVSEAPSPAQLKRTLVLNLLAGTAAVLAAGLLLRGLKRAEPADFGLAPGSLAADTRLGLGTLAALLYPTMGLNLALVQLFPHLQGRLDPLPMFLFGLVTGTVYQRTRRLWPLIVAHAGFNAYNLSLALAARLPGA